MMLNSFLFTPVFSGVKFAVFKKLLIAREYLWLDFGTFVAGGLGGRMSLYKKIIKKN